MLEEDLIVEVMNVLNPGKIPKGWNETIIVLIPKKDDRSDNRVTTFPLGLTHHLRHLFLLKSDDCLFVLFLH